jgi:hypothetical protein
MKSSCIKFSGLVLSLMLISGNVSAQKDKSDFVGQSCRL